MADKIGVDVKKIKGVEKDRCLPTVKYCGKHIMNLEFHQCTY